MTQFSRLLLYAVACLVFAVTLFTYSVQSAAGDAIPQGAFPKNAEEILRRELHKIVTDRELKTNTNLLEESADDVTTQARFKNPNDLLKGNRQRSYTYTPKGTMNEGFKMTPLDDYVSRPDNNYVWQEFSQFYDNGAYRVHFLNVTSQQWLNEATVSRSIWWHIVGVIVPYNLSSSTHAYTYITGSGNPGQGTIPGPGDEGILLGSTLAIETQTISVVVWQIPNQRLYFLDEKPTPKSRTEDAIIAYTWNHFLHNPEDSDWLLRNPMVKGVNRALDAVEEYVEKKFQHKIEKWTISGASKRGWTTWILAAYDQAHEKRVAAFIPMVESFVNMRKQFHDWWRSNGGWSFALEDYYSMNFTETFDGPNADRMGEIIDPYHYFDRYKDIPLLQVMASGDEFFQLSDTHNYWDDIPGEKHLLICENSEHSLATALVEMIPSMISFYKSVVHNLKRPQVSWKFDKTSNKIIVESDVPPTNAKIWFAKTYSSKRIDFRVIRLDSEEEPCLLPKVKGLCPQPILWLPLKAKKITPTRYEGSVASPTSGWASFFINVEFANYGGGTEKYPHLFTTEAIIFPDVKPFEDCVGTACTGKLI